MVARDPHKVETLFESVVRNHGGSAPKDLLYRTI